MLFCHNDSFFSDIMECSEEWLQKIICYSHNTTRPKEQVLLKSDSEYATISVHHFYRHHAFWQKTSNLPIHLLCCPDPCRSEMSQPVSSHSTKVHCQVTLSRCWLSFPVSHVYGIFSVLRSMRDEGCVNISRPLRPKSIISDIVYSGCYREASHKSRQRYCGLDIQSKDIQIFITLSSPGLIAFTFESSSQTTVIWFLCLLMAHVICGLSVTTTLQSSPEFSLNLIHLKYRWLPYFRLSVTCTSLATYLLRVLTTT